MASEKRVISIPLFGGVDTKNEDKQVGMTKSVKLENAVMQRTGEISKRPGYETQGTAVYNRNSTQPDGELVKINSLHSFNDKLVSLSESASNAGLSTIYMGPGVHSYIPEDNKWVNNGYYFPCTFEVDPVTWAGFNDVKNPSIAEGSDMRVIVYQDDDLIYADVLDSETGVVYQEKLSLHGGGTSPKVFYIADGYGQNFLTISADGTIGIDTEIKGRIIDTSDPTDGGTAVVYIDDYDAASGMWDATRIDYDDGYSHAVVAYRRKFDGTIGVVALDGQGNWVKSQVIEAVPKDCMTIQMVDHSDLTGYSKRIYLLYRDENTNDVDGYTFNEHLELVETVQTFTTDLNSNYKLKNITLCKDRASSWDALDRHNPYSRVFIESEGISSIKNPQENRTFLFTRLITYAGAGSGTTEFMYGMGLYSRAFYYNGHPFVLAVHESGLQNTYFLITTKGEVIADAVNVAKILYGKAQGLREHGLADVIETSSGRFVTAITKQARALSNNLKEHNAAVLKLNLDPDAIPAIQVGNSPLVGGGIIGTFDRQWQEHGFLLHPENIALDASGASGSGAMGDGYRSYRVTYSWVDRNGEKQISAPSEAIGYEYAVGSDTQSEIVYVNYSHMTEKNNKGPNTRIDIYRTVANGSTFHLVADDQNANFAGTNILTSTDAGSESDFSIQDNEILYTDGGALPNVAPPASVIMAASKDRAFLVPMDDPETVWFSKQKVEGIALEFSEGLEVRIEKGGPNKGLAVLDDKVIVFKEREIYFFAGEGPNDLGQGGFSPVRQISSDVGCVDSASVINFGRGVLFKSHKGIYLLDRSLQASYIGAPVEQWNNYRVKTATLLEDKNQVRFMLERGAGVLNYDYYHNQWSRFTNHPGKTAVVHNGKYNWATGRDGLVRTEGDNFDDVNFAQQMRVRTGWIKLGGLQGYQRVRKAMILGRYRSPHTLNVKVYTDYDDVNVSQTVTFASSDGMSGNEPLQYEIHIKDQKCQAIQFEIWDSNQSVTLESCALTSIDLEVAQKRGMNKLPTRKRD